MKIAPLSYREVIHKVRKAGFVFKRATGGTHEIWWNEEKKKTAVIPHHHEIRLGTLRSIIRQMGLTREEFLKL